MDRKSCPKCGKQMQPGVLIDSTHGALLQPIWAAEPIPRSRLTKRGLAPPRTFWGKFKIPIYPVYSYRCPSCGLLESYAVTAEK